MNRKQHQELIRIRQHLHSVPDLSGRETATAEYLKVFLEGCDPDNLITGLGGAGIATTYDSAISGPRVLLRCDMDALPIREAINVPYRSRIDKVSHKCGHDGHMAIMAGVAAWLSENRPPSGSVVLLFQPAEETGEGARRVLDDPGFQEIVPDYVFALHNLPGFPMGSIILRDGIFASASKGIIIKLSGLSSHAAEPHLGRSPALAIARIIDTFNDLSSTGDSEDDEMSLNVVHVRIGEPAFGISPGEGYLMATLRTYNREAMETLSHRLEDTAEKIAGSHGLDARISWTEEFPVTENSDRAVNAVRKAAEHLGCKILKPIHPFPWSEDFGHFTMNYSGALFGIGSGLKSPPLHSPEYDFPDDLIPLGINIYREILNGILK